MRPRALILDFDGLMVDSEMTEYVAWKEIYEGEGAHLTVADWLGAVGYVNGFNPRAHLEKQVGRALDWAPRETRRLARIGELHAALDQPLPGVAALVEQGARLGFRLGVASNSTAAWVTAGLKRLGWAGRFETVRTRDDVAAPKPAPDVYRRVLEDLGAPAAGSIAFEDSQPGVAAAKAAGLFVVAVPNELTRQQDLSLADLTVDALEGFDLDRITLSRW